MRIRTLKPDFWTHPVMGRLPGEIQAIAIGLLNVADDDGYFWADPNAVRSALRPFDSDSRSTTVALRELSKHGWIEVRNHPKRGPVGLILAFSDHQVINKPSPSNIKQHWDDSLPEDYGSTTVALPGERKGKERKGREEVDASVAQLKDAWNTCASDKLPRWKVTTPKREKAALAWIAENPPPTWPDFFGALNGQPFALGENDRGWRADPDWCLKPDSTAKILEGKYGTTQRPQPATAAQVAHPMFRSTRT